MHNGSFEIHHSQMPFDSGLLGVGDTVEPDDNFDIRRRCANCGDDFPSTTTLLYLHSDPYDSAGIPANCRCVTGDFGNLSTGVLQVAILRRIKHNLSQFQNSMPSLTPFLGLVSYELIAEEKRLITKWSVDFNGPESIDSILESFWEALYDFYYPPGMNIKGAE